MTQTDKRKIIVDTDTDFDDLIAIAWLLTQPQIEIIAFVCTGTGWSHSPQGADNLCKFLSLCGRTDIPVLLGCKEPLSNTSNIPQEKRNEVDLLWGVELPTADFTYHPDGVSQLLALLSKLKCPIEYFCIGPLTTLATALIKNSTVAKQIKRLSIMGGHPHENINIEGYTGNARMDLAATEIAYQQNFPILTYSSEAIKKCVVDHSVIENIKITGKSPVVSFICKLLKELEGSDLKLKYPAGMFIWDLVAAFAFVHPECTHKVVNHVVFLRDQYGKYSDILVSSEGIQIEVVEKIDLHCNILDLIFAINLER